MAATKNQDNPKKTKNQDNQKKTKKMNRNSGGGMECERAEDILDPLLVRLGEHSRCDICQKHTTGCVYSICMPPRHNPEQPRCTNHFAHLGCEQCISGEHHVDPFFGKCVACVNKYRRPDGTNDERKKFFMGEAVKEYNIVNTAAWNMIKEANNARSKRDANLTHDVNTTVDCTALQQELRIVKEKLNDAVADRDDAMAERDVALAEKIVCEKHALAMEEDGIAHGESGKIAADEARAAADATKNADAEVAAAGEARAEAERAAAEATKKADRQGIQTQLKRKKSAKGGKVASSGAPRVKTDWRGMYNALRKEHDDILAGSDAIIAKRQRVRELINEVTIYQKLTEKYFKNHKKYNAFIRDVRVGMEDNTSDDESSSIHTMSD